MRRQLKVSLLLGAGLLLLACLIRPTPAVAAPVSTAAVGHTYLIEQYPTGPVKIREVNAATGQTVDYPDHGPVHPWRWKKLRYNPDTGAYHPSVCVDSFIDISQPFPVKSVTGAWNQAQFFLWYEATSYDPQVGGYCSHTGWPDHARIDVEYGGRRDTCTHGYITVDDDYKVTRAISYIDTLNLNCGFYSDIETTIWRLSRGMGNMIGLKNHDGDGSPSVHATKVYIWPTAYDDRTVMWFN